MVYGPGGYRFRDYVRLGLPLTVLVVVGAVVLVPLVGPMRRYAPSDVSGDVPFLREVEHNLLR